MENFLGDFQLLLKVSLIIFQFWEQLLKTFSQFLEEHFMITFTLQEGFSRQKFLLAVFLKNLPYQVEIFLMNLDLLAEMKLRFLK